MSLDKVDLEVLKRSGTATEKKYAARIMPVVSRPHLLLVTLLLCNAGAMEVRAPQLRGLCFIPAWRFTSEHFIQVHCWDLKLKRKEAFDGLINGVLTGLAHLHRQAALTSRGHCPLCDSGPSLRGGKPSFQSCFESPMDCALPQELGMSTPLA